MKKGVLAVMGGLCLVVWGLLIMDVRFTPAKASPSPYLNFDGVTEDSQVTVREGATHISLFAASGDPLYETQGSGATGATQFLAADPQAGSANLLPEEFREGARASRVVDDETGRSHYFYQQTIDGVPVYGAQLAVHQMNDNQIYSLTGNIATNREVMRGPLTKEGAQDIAVAQAGKETSASLKATSAEEVVFNGMAMGINDDASNYLSWAVTVESLSPEVIYGKKFIVNSASGDVLFTEDVVRKAMDRRIHSCNESSNCTQGRFEGQEASGVDDVNLVYDTFGTYYNLMSTSFERDSFDNLGSPMLAYVDYRDQTCPNAWMSRGRVFVCKGLVAKDVVSHEMTHAMDQSTAKFTYANQSGAIDESIADIFASAIDGNYTMGETTQLGIIRSMEDPASRGQPDRLFSPNYWCRIEDYGGVHKNGGILSKAYMLMVQGGSFNGCTVTGIGKEKANAIIYKALVNYMTATTNFKDAYNAILQSCADLNGGDNSAACIQVRNSMRATEMDQQTEGSQKGPKCENKQASAPNCSAGPDQPGSTSTPVPGGPTSVPNPTGNPTAGPTRPPASGETVTLALTLRFQGVFAKPVRSEAVPVAVSLSGGKLASPLTKLVNFEWQSNGTAKGTADFASVPPGGGYIVSVKPPLHMTRRICDTAPVEIFEGRYKCAGQTLTLNKGSNTINAQGILQIAGDLPDESGKQDNLINSYDLGLVRNSMGKKDASLIKRADLNYDGNIDQADQNIINISATAELN